MNTTNPDDLKSRKLGLSRAEKREYSIARAVREYLVGGPSALTGIAKDCHQELDKEMRFEGRGGGILVPFEVLEPDTPRRRDLSATVFGQGGAFVETSVRPDVVPVFRNMAVMERQGARIITGLSGNLALPRQTATATPYSLGEQVGVALSTQAVDQILMTPHRVSALCQYSRQLVLSSSVDVESFLRDDLVETTAVKMDSLCLNGQGGAECTGILNTTGIGSLIFGGSASWTSIVAFENSLGVANALGRPNSRVGWIVSPATKSRLKIIAKNGVGVTSVVPIFLWSDATDGSEDGYLNGYRGASSNQVINNQVFFGNFNDVIIGIFGRGAELIIDPYKLAEQATVRVVVNLFFDLAVLHAQSWCVSEDAGNQ